MEQQQGHIHIRKVISHKSGVPYGSMLIFLAVGCESWWIFNRTIISLRLNWQLLAMEDHFLSTANGFEDQAMSTASPPFPPLRASKTSPQDDLWWFDVIFLSEHDLQGLGICFKMFQAQQISLWSAVSWRNRPLFAAAPLKWVGPCSLYMSPGVKLGIQRACCGICEKPKPEHHLYTNPAKMR